MALSAYERRLQRCILDFYEDVGIASLHAPPVGIRALEKPVAPEHLEEEIRAAIEEEFLSVRLLEGYLKGAAVVGGRAAD